MTHEEVRCFLRCPYAWYLRYVEGHRPLTWTGTFFGRIAHQIIKNAYAGCSLPDAHRRVWRHYFTDPFLDRLDKWVLLDHEYAAQGGKRTKTAKAASTEWLARQRFATTSPIWLATTSRSSDITRCRQRVQRGPECGRLSQSQQIIATIVEFAGRHLPDEEDATAAIVALQDFLYQLKKDTDRAAKKASATHTDTAALPVQPWLLRVVDALVCVDESPDIVPLRMCLEQWYRGFTK